MKKELGTVTQAEESGGACTVGPPFPQWGLFLGKLFSFVCKLCILGTGELRTKNGFKLSLRACAGRAAPRPFQAI